MAIFLISMLFADLFYPVIKFSLCVGILDCDTQRAPFIQIVPQVAYGDRLAIEWNKPEFAGANSGLIVV
jgi:hypothetical protein